jgi:hypothetical protein
MARAVVSAGVEVLRERQESLKQSQNHSQNHSWSPRLGGHQWRGCTEGMLLYLISAIT